MCSLHHQAPVLRLRQPHYGETGVSLRSLYLCVQPLSPMRMCVSRAAQVSTAAGDTCFSDPWAMQEALHLQVERVGGCALARHPTWGTHVYPCSLLLLLQPTTLGHQDWQDWVQQQLLSQDPGLAALPVVVISPQDGAGQE